MSCICAFGCRETVTYTGRTAAFQSKPDGSELVLCKWCEGVVSKTPTSRERLFREGRLAWQSRPDRKPHGVRMEPEPDFNFAGGRCRGVPAANSTKKKEEYDDTATTSVRFDL